jgi:metal-dependent amidase/aminoacylase/carboxypeptidase family protein
MHITSLLAAADLLLKAKSQWHGTLILCFQPAEEKGAGAQAMVDDGLYTKVPEPDIVLGGHVMPYRTG